MNGGHVIDLVRHGTRKQGVQRFRVGHVEPNVAVARGINPARSLLARRPSHRVAPLQQHLTDIATVLAVHSQDQGGGHCNARPPSRSLDASRSSSMFPVISALAISASRLAELTTVISGSGKIMLVPF